MAAATTRAHGFFGKLPARGDFVGSGLPAAVVRPWDRCITCLLATARASLGDRWSNAWLQAPVWRFALPATACGPAPLVGLWMPSVDRAGRHFPLMLAATCPGATPEQMARHGAAWLDMVEDAGRAAIADDLTPDQLSGRIPPAPELAEQADSGLPHELQPRSGAGFWWTDGAPLVTPHALVLDTMPDAATFATVLNGGPPQP